MARYRQESLLSASEALELRPGGVTTFAYNMSLPVHRWFRYSAGFSAEWVESVICEEIRQKSVTVLDPFAGSGTTLLVAESVGVKAWGVEAHPFVYRIAESKLKWRANPASYLAKIEQLRNAARSVKTSISDYPPLIRKCYDDEVLAKLDAFRRGYELTKDGTPESQLAWLTLVAILRPTSKAGTAQWQYVLPKKQKRAPLEPSLAIEHFSRMIHEDMKLGQSSSRPPPKLILGDARVCAGIPEGSVNLVITSPPYPNNYDYADATRLEMSFMGEVKGWGDLQDAVRRYLVCSCSQHAPESSAELKSILASPELEVIRPDLTQVCNELSRVRETKGGKKTYHLMVASYFRDLARVWRALRKVCTTPSRICFIIGDSAPYGVYVRVVPWLGQLALAAGFKNYSFEKTRDRNIKWKNRKHRVPLQEGRLWVEG